MKDFSIRVHTNIHIERPKTTICAMVYIFDPDLQIVANFSFERLEHN